MEQKVSITNKTRVPFPRFPLSLIKDDILGAGYELSVVFIGEKESREVNRKYRDKDNATNILTFPFDKRHGEILLCPAVIRREVKEKKFDKNFRELCGFLVIHGMLHLKGVRHSSTMERTEAAYDKKYFSRDRRRLRNDARRGGRDRQRRKKS